jgi:thiamine-monophosphate kinase
LADLGHILERSRLGAEIHLHRIPCDAAVRGKLAQPLFRQAVLTGGDDYELCFTAAPVQAKTIAKIAQLVDVPLTAIGRIVAEQDVKVLDENGVALVLEAKGFDHFN